MHFTAHAGVGWTIGVLAPGSDRRLRACCLGAAIIPDIDALPFVFGPDAYTRGFRVRCADCCRRDVRP